MRYIARNLDILCLIAALIFFRLGDEAPLPHDTGLYTLGWGFLAGAALIAFIRLLMIGRKKAINENP